MNPTNRKTSVGDIRAPDPHAVYLTSLLHELQTLNGGMPEADALDLIDCLPGIVSRGFLLNWTAQRTALAILEGPESCAFCGVRIVDPCERAPADTCERALDYLRQRP